MTAKVYIDKSFAKQSYDLVVILSENLHTVNLLTPEGVLNHPASHTLPSEAILNISEKEVQFLMDLLWGLGIRPKGYADQGVIAEKQAHIETLQGMVGMLYNLTGGPAKLSGLGEDGEEKSPF